MYKVEDKKIIFEDNKLFSMLPSLGYGSQGDVYKFRLDKDFYALKVFNGLYIEKLENGNKYKVTMSLPLTTGWIDYLDLVIEKGNETLTFPLKHKRNENNLIIFETELYLETRAIYHYYFRYKVNNEKRNLLRQNLI